MVAREEIMQKAVADYLIMQRPGVVFHSDFGSGTKLTMSQAVRQKRLNGGRRAWPDLFVAEPVGKYHGLFLELKASGVRVVKRNGEWASEHIAEQADVLGQLRQRGYAAEFAVGYDMAIDIINKYLGGNL